MARDLNITELSQIAGGTCPIAEMKEWSFTKKAAVGLLISCTFAGAKKLIIDTFNMVPVNTYSVFLGEALGSVEHISHIKSKIAADVGVIALGILAHNS